MKGNNFSFEYCGKLVSFNLPKPEDHIQKKIIESKNFYEIDVLEELARFPSKEGIVCDIGANLGNHTVYFGSILNKKVLAFEPVAISYDTLIKNIELNNLNDAVVAYPIALGDRETNAIISINETNIGASKIIRTEEGDTKITTLDSLINEIVVVSIIKIDVEGFELNVLHGALKTIQKNKPLLIIETQTHIDYINVFAFLNELEYIPVSQKGATNTVFFIHKSEVLGNPFYNFLSRVDNQTYNNQNMKRYREILNSQKENTKIITKEVSNLREEFVGILSERNYQQAEIVSLKEELEATLSERNYQQAEIVSLKEELEATLSEHNYQQAEIVSLKEELEANQKKSIKYKQNILIKENQIKSQLSYRIGYVIVKHSNLKNFWKIPSRVYNEYNDFKKSRNNDSKNSPEVLQNISHILEYTCISQLKLLNSIIQENQNLKPNKSLIVKNILNEVKIEQINEQFEWLYEQCTLLDVNSILYQKILILYKNHKNDTNQIFLIDKIIQFLHYYLKDEDKAVLKQIIDDKLLLSSSKEKKSFIHLLPIFEEFYDSKQLQLIISNQFTLHELIDDCQFVNCFIKAPVYYSKFIDQKISDYLSIHFDRYENILAYFLYRIIVYKQIDLATVMLYFKIGKKHKLKFINAVRRFSYDIQNSHNLNIGDIKNEVKIDVDCLYLGMIKPAVKDTSDLNISTNMSVEAKSYLLSNYGQNDLLKQYINDILEAESLVILSKSIDAENINHLYKKIMSSIEVSLEKAIENEKISVIIATFNPNIELLELSIQSILGQTYNNLEIIVVDDNSKNSNEIKRLLDKYNILKYHRNEENYGPYVSRNLAIKMAEGYYIAFQDDDDISHLQRFKYQINKLKTTTADLVTVSHIRFDQNACVQIDLAGHYISDGPVTMVFRKELIEKVGNFQEVKSRGDVEFRSRVKVICGETSHLHCEIPLYYSYGAPSTLSSKYEYGEDFIKLELQRAEMGYYAKQKGASV